MPDGDHSASNHPTALASQVAWITGESQISRHREIILPAREPNLPAREPNLPEESQISRQRANSLKLYIYYTILD
jgi:hypothetical protein